MSQVPLAPPPSTGGPLDSWLYLLWRRLTQAGQILWESITPGTSADVAAAVTDETGSPGSLVFSANPTLQGATVDGDALISGTARRIKGDFSNATSSSRTMFETSTANSITSIGIKPSGTGSNGALLAFFADGDVDNSIVGQFFAVIGGAEIRISSNKTGTATYAPLTFFTSAVEKARIATDGTFTAGGIYTAPGLKVTPVASQARWVEVAGATSSGNPQLATTAGELLLPQNIVLPKTSGKGIQVDTAAPTFGWRDIIGQIGVKTAGATDPVWTLYRGAMYAYTFDTATAEAFLVFHIPHDYVPGSDLFAHVHWSQNVVDTGGTAGVPGVAEWKFDISYADGHGTAGGAADPFIAPITVTVTQQASTTQYGHMIAEVQFTNNGGTGGLIDSNTIQVDGLLLVRLYRVKANPADTLNQAPFVHTADIHYQSTNIGTKQKAPNFYT